MKREMATTEQWLQAVRIGALISGIDAGAHLNLMRDAIEPLPLRREDHVLTSIKEARAAKIASQNPRPEMLFFTGAPTGVCDPSPLVARRLDVFLLGNETEMLGAVVAVEMHGHMVIFMDDGDLAPHGDGTSFGKLVFRGHFKTESSTMVWLETGKIRKQAG